MSKRGRIFVAVCVGLVVVVVWSSGLANEFSDAGRIRRLVEDAGIFAPVVFVLIAMAMFLIFMLGPPVWASVALWPLPVAFSLSFAASFLGSLLTYLVGRRLGREWAERRIPAAIRRHQERLEARPHTTIVTLRLLLWANPFVDLLVAFSHVPLRPYVLGTAVGLVPPTALHVLLAAGGLEAARRLPAWSWVLLAAAVGAGIVAVRGMSGRQRARAARGMHAVVKEEP